ncbi:MAG: c-type cytochrome [Ferruginibacter sp.]
MKRIRLLLTLSILTIGVLIIFISCNSDEGSAIVKTTTDSAQLVIEHGKYLAHTVAGCMDCHSERDFTQFSGPVKPGTEGMGGFALDEKFQIPGVVYTRNITPDTVNGIGKWTDDEIARTITTGITKNGDTLFPIMPYPHYNQMSKNDVYSIIAYLRTLKPSDNKVPPRKLFIPLSMAYPPLQSRSLDQNKKPDVSDIVKYGGYLVNSAACMDCHTPRQKGQMQMHKLFAGGFFFDMGAFKVNSANITPDSATGIGKWTEAVFMEKFKNYRDPASYSANPGKNNTLMPWAIFAHLDDFDLKAIYRYLRTLPPVQNKVVKYPE